MPKPKIAPNIGLYIEIVMHGHGAHEIIGAWDVPPEKAEELQTVIESHPELFTPRKS